ncbi:unnamed protein product [Bursaphelenchus xylophilus]|uniref:(pine wood nematode) hypothetical protein n=1 Tax=Bursaphelenchus xylophilus TaxID=6326 RepID=A0A1I7RMF3_BURXY|nr:unnamed protein product [Bursaphelenchus xylophilus]CAG9118435.1 unnamed protein product [Bursaphelenchus xylophilus]
MTGLFRSLAILLICSLLADSLVIYRRKPKPRLVCHEEYDDELSSENSSDGDADGYQVTTTAVRVKKPKTRTKRESEKITLRFDERVKRMDLQDGDFEIIGENLSSEEKAAIKQKLVQTCNTLNIRNV